MKIFLKALLYAIAILITFSTFLYAQQQVEKEAEETKYTEVKYSADISSYRWEGDDRILVLNGNVKFIQGDTTVLADKVDYRERTHTANVEGSLKIFDDQSTITGDKCSINFKEKKISVGGNVQMVTKPEKKNVNKDSDLKDEMVLTCELIEYWYKDKHGVIPSALTIVQKSRTITADSAEYFGRDEIVRLAGNVKVKDDKERHSFFAPKVTISLKDKDEWIEAEKATGSFFIKEETEKKSASPTPAVDVNPPEVSNP